MKFLIRCLIIMVFVSLAAANPVNAQADVLLSRINNLRASLGLGSYTINGALSSAAQSHAQWMATTKQVSHTQSNGSTPSTRAAAAGYPGAWVSENIYGGTGASLENAWNFWVNSPIHYRGLTNASYSEIGIGVAESDGWRFYVLVFGNPGGSVNLAPRTSGGENSGAAAAPSFIVGQDNFGNIMHEVQEGQTIGDIALLYGYTWDDIPEMLSLNEMTDTDIRLLQPGGIFLVPPYSGTYTPTAPPEGWVSPTPNYSNEDIVNTAVAFAKIKETEGFLTQRASVLLTPFVTPTAPDTEAAGDTASTQGETLIQPPVISTSQEVPAVLGDASVTPTYTQQPTLTASPDNLGVGLAPTQAFEGTAVADTTTGETSTTVDASIPSEGVREVIVVQERTSPWLIAALIAQGVIIVGASLEYIRRSRKS